MSERKKTAEGRQVKGERNNREQIEFCFKSSNQEKGSLILKNPLNAFKE